MEGLESVNLWNPEWKVDLGDGSELGVAIDDSCYVVLYPTEDGRWRPGNHIPPAIARLIGRLAT